MKLPQAGGCLCGAVRYEVTQPPIVTYTCHCTACQRLTGSAFSSALIVAAEACRFAGAEPRSFQRPADSGRTVTRWVCAECGTWICNGAKPGTAPPDSYSVIGSGDAPEGGRSWGIGVSPDADRAVRSGTGGLY